MPVLTLRGIAKYASELPTPIDIWEGLTMPQLPTGAPYIQWDAHDHGGETIYTYHGINRDTYLINKEALIKRIYYLSMNFSALWQDPEALKDWITNVNYTHKLKWQEMYSSFFYSYNPIWNKDGSWSESHNVTVDNTTQTPNQWMTESKIMGTYKKGIRDFTQAYNDNGDSIVIPGGPTTGEAWTKADATVEATEYPDDGSYSQTSEQKGTLTTSHTFSENTTHQEGGNIGITQTTEMILAQRRMVEMYNMYDIIAWDIIKELCVMIYQ